MNSQKTQLNFHSIDRPVGQPKKRSIKDYFSLADEKIAKIKSEELSTKNYLINNLEQAKKKMKIYSGTDIPKFDINQLLTISDFQLINEILSCDKGTRKFEEDDELFSDEFLQSFISLK